MTAKKAKFLENDNMLLLVAAGCSAATALGVPLVQWVCSAALVFAALRKGWQASLIFAAAVAPPVLAAIYLESASPLFGVLLCLSVYVPICLYRAARSWSVVSELLGLIALGAAIVIQWLFPEALVFTASLFKTQLASMPESPMNAIEVTTLAHVVLGIQLLTGVVFNFLFLVLMVRVYNRYTGKKVNAVGFVPMSQIYAFTWLASIVLYAVTQDLFLLTCTAALSGTAVCSGGSWIHDRIGQKLMKQNGGSRLLLFVYYIGVFMLLPWSLVFLALIALGQSIQGMLMKRQK